MNAEVGGVRLRGRHTHAQHLIILADLRHGESSIEDIGSSGVAKRDIRDELILMVDLSADG